MSQSQDDRAAAGTPEGPTTERSSDTGVKGDRYRDRKQAMQWFYLGAVPRIVRLALIVSLALFLVRGVQFLMVRRNEGHLASDSSLWSSVSTYAAELVCFMLMLLMTTWAKRYCQARADGRL